MDEDPYSDDSFVLYQMRAKINMSTTQQRVPKKTHLIANLPYRLKQYQTYHKYLRVRLDTCTDVNIMPKSVYQMMFNDPEVQQLAPNDISLGVYTDHQVDILGKCNFFMIHPDTKKPHAVTFYVASNEGSVLLSCTTLLALELIQTRPQLDYLPPRAKLITSAADHPTMTKKTAHQAKATKEESKLMHKNRIKMHKNRISMHKNSIKMHKNSIKMHKNSVNMHKNSVKMDNSATKQGNSPVDMQIEVKMVRRKADIKEYYADVFEGVGRFPGPPYHIQLDPKVPPKQTPVRPVPVHLKEAFKQELDKMLQAGQLKPVHEATPWINSYVIVEGKDKLGRLKPRICLDPKNLNLAVIREPWFSKTPDDIAHLLADACIITTTDCTKGFWHQPLDEESSYLTTFGTEYGRFRFTIMPFGITVAGDVFQRKLDTIFGHLSQVACIADNIIIVGYKVDHSDHDTAFTKLLQTARENNVKLNFEKLQYKQTQVDFFGETYTTDGRKPSSDKVQAITNMPQSVNKKELQSFVGMVNYLSKFTPRLSELAECLRDLIRINVPFQWGPEHTEAFTSIKQEIIHAPVLKYYDPKKPMVLQTDASIKGLGACLLQCGHPVYFGSKALTDSQKGYVAIELEALAVSWTMEKFHHFLYATKFVLETDQKPLETILAKSLNAATPRPLDDNLTSPMQILQGRTARSDLLMPYAAKVKFGLASGQPSLLRPEKNERAPTHDYKLNQDVMYLDPVSNKWFPATIVRLLTAKRSYLIRTPEGVEYRKTQQHLKLYKPRKPCVPPKPMKASHPAQGRPKRRQEFFFAGYNLPFSSILLNGTDSDKDFQNMLKFSLTKMQQLMSIPINTNEVFINLN